MKTHGISDDPMIRFFYCIADDKEMYIIFLLLKRLNKKPEAICPCLLGGPVVSFGASLLLVSVLVQQIKYVQLCGLQKKTKC